ncbi:MULTISPECIES: DUF6708 domain-containing protein [unclassified Pseudomonas]|uniref:DUF6708 domain-containing protein n=1 Tax=unclassified Pseudomonas TaxID=196821 RepID=UPI001F5B9D8D|nr:MULTISPECIES: DUF6708 domain-containing protein [unclassified Pseudomonas]
MIYFDTPNHQNDIYLEICRANSRARGILIWFAFLSFFSLIDTATTLLTGSRPYHSTISLLSLCVIALTFWSSLLFLRFDIAPPRDEPIRFNRVRQRIYAYNFKYRWWNPFERWRVVPVTYDWSQVRAERWKLRGATAQGALIIKWGVVLSIVEPGTNKVIDRFPLSTMGADEFAWAYICTYMQQGPSALPPPGPPHDHNDVPWYNLALRLAPKVKWPAEMDRESRTAP